MEMMINASKANCSKHNSIFQCCDHHTSDQLKSDQVKGKQLHDGHDHVKFNKNYIHENSCYF